MKIEVDDVKLSRRELLGHAARATFALPAAAAFGAIAGCGEGGEKQAAESPEEPPGAKAPPPTPPASAKPAPAAAESGEERLVTEIPANATLVTSLKYVNASPEAEKRCGNCQLYTAGEGGRGKCTLFQSGLVAEAGWCQSWVAKVG